MFTHFRVFLSPGYTPKGYTDVVANNYNQDNEAGWINFYQKDGRKTDSFARHSVVRIQQINKVADTVSA